MRTGELRVDNSLIFLKLGGSLLTDKQGVEVLRPGVLARLAGEIAAARASRPGLGLVLGHGSGSFGHVAAAKYGTRQGVVTGDEWRGFAEVSAAAMRLNVLVREALLAAGVPAVSLPPSASAVCVDGRIQSLATWPVSQALESGVVPVVFGDVAFDSVLGGTIVSTEEVLSYLSATLRPSWLLLAGETEGVYDTRGRLIPRISAGNPDVWREALGGSAGTDVTGGMSGKVDAMLALAESQPGLSICILSGATPGRIRDSLLLPDRSVGTRIG